MKFCIAEDDWRAVLARLEALEAQVAKLLKPKPLVLKDPRGRTLWSGEIRYGDEDDL